MSTISFVPIGDNDKAIWIGNFSTKLPIHAATLGITTAEVTSVQKDAAMCLYIVSMQEAYKQTLRNIIGYKKLLFKASGQQHLGTTLPGAPVLATAPTAVPEGIFDRISKLAARIKASAGYTDNIGLDLGIIAPVSASSDPTALQPELKVKLDAGRPHIKWVKGETDALELYANHNDGSGFILMGRFTRNEYLDVTTLPANKLFDEWSYKAIYLINDQPVGLYSDIVSIDVKRV